MFYELTLTNSQEKCILDEEVLQFFKTDPTLSKMDFVNNLQLHSTGLAIFRKEWKESDGSYVIETIYLHKLIADNYLPQRGDSQVLIFKNGNKLDCRLENLEYGLRGLELGNLEF